MKHLYDIIIEGQPIHKGLSEEMFFDIMEDLSDSFYRRGFPHPDSISHTCYTEE